ncbi:methyltransferase domain-containing protein [Colletotrichum plurivorum]|uniref:Methyltransferase domain-containing protein n=1 Tax=Colletotrichum plurivorum TaxID=2175906 RepID=A0A8H6MV10_9PEZI|nr:methyltransferase domain-containing protein [Colletotrichum plurivorum]
MSAPNDAPSGATVTIPATAPVAQPAAGIVQVTEEQQIAADEESIASSTTSLAESIFNFRVENGRTYHRYKEGKYSYPNDERESDRLDLQHHQYLLSLHGKLGLAPPNEEDSKVKRVLDVGTGTGIWAIDFGELHPDAEVLGMDLSPSNGNRPPPNVVFEVDDIEEPWLYSRPFDYIHCRMMTSSLSDWRKFIQRSYDNLTPGGYLEIQEIELMPQCDDGTMKPDAAMVRCFQLLGEAATVLGRSFQDVPGLVDVMKEVGFVDIHITKLKWPTNTWPKDDHHKLLGAWGNENSMRGIEGWTMAPLTRALGWKREEVDVFLTDVRKEFNDRSIHAWWPG